jgi:hypothetical protein
MIEAIIALILVLLGLYALFAPALEKPAKQH